MSSAHHSLERHTPSSGLFAKDRNAPDWVKNREFVAAGNTLFRVNPDTIPMPIQNGLREILGAKSSQLTSSREDMAALTLYALQTGDKVQSLPESFSSANGRRPSDQPDWVKEGKFLALKDSFFRIDPEDIPQPVRETVERNIIGVKYNDLTDAYSIQAALLLLILQQKQMTKPITENFPSNRTNKEDAPDWVKNHQFIALGQHVYKIDPDAIPQDIQSVIIPSLVGVTELTSRQEVNAALVYFLTLR